MSIGGMVGLGFGSSGGGGGGGGDCPTAVEVADAVRAELIVELSRIMSLPLNATTGQVIARGISSDGEIVVFKGEMFRPGSIAIKDAAGAPLPLTGRTLVMMIQDKNSVLRLTLTTTAGTLVISGDDDSSITILGGKLSSTMIGDFNWNIRDVTGGPSLVDDVLTFGTLVVKNYLDYVP
jgi:hypothetical protein